MSDLFSTPPPAAGIPAPTTVVCRLALELPNGMARAILEHGDGRITVATIKPDQTETIDLADCEVTFMPDEAISVAHAVLTRPRTAAVAITPKIRALSAMVLLLAHQLAERK